MHAGFCMSAMEAGVLSHSNKSRLSRSEGIRYTEIQTIYRLHRSPEALLPLEHGLLGDDVGHNVCFHCMGDKNLVSAGVDINIFR